MNLAELLDKIDHEYLKQERNKYDLFMAALMERMTADGEIITPESFSAASFEKMQRVPEFKRCFTVVAFHDEMLKRMRKHTN